MATEDKNQPLLRDPSCVQFVRVASEVDAAEITRVINAAFRQAEGFFIDDDRISLGGVESLLDSGTFIVIECDEQLIACVYLEQRGERAYLGLLSVDPNVQRLGLGSVLMGAAEDHCRREGLNCIDINVVNLREELPTFYRKRGYVETGTSPFPSDAKTKIPCYFIEMSKLL
ncbi:MAG TPA: GNAT family N-acetyltransferase [Pyrinomonadaceae bacterium]|nr:GNAT family N-acetyltransferase [Pyrinomonadaceae bacterium]